MVTQSQFLRLLHDIEPSATTKSNASQAHQSLRTFLKTHSEFEKVHVETFLSGSYKRDTAIRPRIVDGEVSRPDVDIIVVTNHSLSDSPSDVIELVYQTLYDRYDDIQRQTRSVGVLTALADMDVVPITAPSGLDGTLYIPDRKEVVWLETNPPGHTTWTTEVNKLTEGRFKPLVKLVKWWRRVNPTISKRPKGFVIECIVAECMSQTEANYPLLFKGLFEAIVDRYQRAVSGGTVPFIADPAVSGNSVTSSTTFDAFSGFYNKVKTHLEIIERALSIGDHNPEEELRLWRQIFSDRFPASETHKATDLLSPAASTGTLSFPNRPIQPRKPGGFA
ncbi:MAG TPA: hypothetical protein PKD55_14960 [Bellilinea sp.]|nr:hypothetical protein [Bellilinea sp.]